MRKTLTLAAALLVAFSMQAADLTVEQILAKNAAAKGGVDKLRALQSVRFTGKMSMGPMEAPLTMTKKRPESMRVDFTVQGMTGTQAFDGTNGWMVMPFMGKKDAEALSGEMLKDLKEQADFDGPFLDPEKKGYKVELLGTEEVEGTKAYKLKLTRDGNDTIVYIDADSFLDIKTVSHRKMQGQEIETETSFGNYQEFGGLLFPTSIETKPTGAAAAHGGHQAITIEKVELNPAVDAALFTMPVKKPEAAAPATKQ
jgi:outer membrane lipoprotein-sorting protein